MDEHINAFIQHLSAHKRYSANTLSAYRNDLGQFFQFVTIERPHLTSWARVDSLLLQAYLLRLRARNYSPASIARKVAAIKSFYFYLLEQQLIAVNPTLELDAPKVTKQPPHPLTVDQVNALLSAAIEATPKGYRDRALMELLYASGVRVTELVMLDVESVDLENCVLRVGREGEMHARSLPLNERAVGALRVYIEKGRAAFQAAAEVDALFLNPRGEPLTRQGVWLILKRYVKQAGIECEVTPHSLRHSFAAHRLQNGERVQDLQRLLGHAHLSTTQVYSRVHRGEHVLESED